MKVAPANGIAAGQRVRHAEFGDGVVLQPEASGFVTVFFKGLRERRVPTDALAPALTWTDEVLAGLRPATPEAIERLRLAVEAERLPLMDNAATLTSAKVDLLPHQVVLVHRSLAESRELGPGQRAVIARGPDPAAAGVLTYWRVTVHSARGLNETRVLPIGLSVSGQRSPRIERLDLLSLVPCQAPAAGLGPQVASLATIASAAANETLRRELQHSGFLPPQASYSAHLLAVAVLCPPR